MGPQAQECRDPHQKREETRNRVSSRVPRSVTPLDFRLLVSKTVREYLSVVSSYEFHSNLLWQPSEINTVTKGIYSLPVHSKSRLKNLTEQKGEEKLSATRCFSGFTNAPWNGCGEVAFWSLTSFQTEGIIV